MALPFFVNQQQIMEINTSSSSYKLSILAFLIVICYFPILSNSQDNLNIDQGNTSRINQTNTPPIAPTEPSNISATTVLPSSAGPQNNISAESNLTQAQTPQEQLANGTNNETSQSSATEAAAEPQVFIEDFFAGNCFFYISSNFSSSKCFNTSDKIKDDQAILDKKDRIQKKTLSQCLKVCCSPFLESVSAERASRVNIIQKCQEFKQDNMKTSTIVFGILTGFCIFISIIVCLIYCMCKCCEKKQQENELIGQNGVISQRRLNAKAINTDWVSTKIGSQGNVCAVCFGVAPSLEFTCKHVYHRQCYNSRLSGQDGCPICKYDEMPNVSVYCEQCFACSFDANIKDIAQLEPSILQICPSCQAKNKQITTSN